MIVFGLVGGIASGKSFVAGLLAERGAVVLDADQHAHAVLDEHAVREALAARWGASVLAADGSLRRPVIAERVFGDSEAATAERRFLEGLVHPRVRSRLQAELTKARGQGAVAAVLDIPLLLEAGWTESCDAVLFVETPLAIRRQRAVERGWSPDDLAQREAAQTPVEEKKVRADAIVPGDNEAAARTAIDALWQRWIAAERPAEPS